MPRLSQVFAVILATSAVAHAEPDKRTRALELAGESERAYKAGDFEHAAALLRQAHDTYPEPTLLYNLGRALENMGDTRGAIAAYEQYLVDAKQIDDRPAIERRLATLEATLEPTPAPPPVAPASPPAETHLAPWLVIGAGGAALATGAVFGWRSSANHDDAVHEAVQRTASQLQATAHTYATTANVLFAVGGAAAIGGGIWLYLAHGDGPRVQLAPTGVAVEWTLR